MTRRATRTERRILLALAVGQSAELERSHARTRLALTAAGWIRPTVTGFQLTEAGEATVAATDLITEPLFALAGPAQLDLFA